MRSTSAGGRRTLAAVLLALPVLLSGCANDSVGTGFLPSEPGLTDRTASVIDHWNGAWVAALLVGILVWALTLWCVVAYRKRKNDDQLPVQLRYHVPLELLYTVVPILMIGVLFFYSARVTSEVLDTSAEPDVRIQVYGKQWSWDFNYLDDDVHFSGDRIAVTGDGDDEGGLPVLYLPVGETVEFTLNSRDVIHSFWIPAFLFKLDTIPGQTNTFQVTPQQEGMYQGKCAELCGESHAEMLFNVAVVDRPTYDAYIQELRDAGNTGILGDEYNRRYDVRAGS